jgi:hypothetical protein
MNCARYGREPLWLAEGIISTFAWSDYVKPQKISVRTDRFLVEFRNNGLRP